MKLILIAIFLLANNALANHKPDLPIVSKPPSCIITATVTPAYGRKRVNGDLDQFDERYYKTKNTIENILRKKGYKLTEDIVCTRVGDEGEVILTSRCNPHTEYYLWIDLSFDHDRIFGLGVVPVNMSVSVYHAVYGKYGGNPLEVGYYYESPNNDKKLVRGKSNEYYDKLLIAEASKIPRCRDLSLQKIVKHK